MDPSTSIHIVRLDGIHTPTPIFSPSFPHTYTHYDSTAPTDAAVIARLQDADVVITTTIPLSATVISALPQLKLVAVLGIGTNHVDLGACEARGIPVCNVPAASNESVAEHALSLFFAVRRRVVRMHAITAKGVEWPERHSVKGEFGGCPRTAREEVVCVIGGGELGNRVANITRALGMTVLFAERKGVPPSEVREGRTHFEEALKTSTAIFLTLPFSESTKNTLSHPEFALMQSETVVVNVARGGIVDEPALVMALEEKKIWGAATDVFFEEPAGLENSDLVRAAEKWEREGSELSGRLVLSPHLAWWAKSSILRLRSVVGSNIEAWVRGKPENLVVSKP